MRLSIVAVAVLVASVSGFTGRVNPEIEQRIQRIERGLVEFTAPMDMLRPNVTEGTALSTLAERMAHYKVPGVSIAVISEREIQWAKGYGKLGADGDTPVTKESLFEAASTSKLIVAAITLRFVGNGVLDLDEDVNKKLKSWKIPENSFTAKRKVTLRMLLTHRAGLNRPDGGFSWEEGSTPTLLQTLNGVAPAENPPAVVEGIPGDKWQYSNFGYLIIQQLLEDVLGEPFAQTARRAVFLPLGMRSSTFAVPLNTKQKKIEAVPHDAEGIAREPEMHPTAVANGGLMTTPSDLALFTNELILAYRGESNRILSRKMVRTMLHRELDLDPALLGVPLGEGLGVLLFGKGQNFAFLHPGDNMPGASSWLMGFPDSGNGIIVMTNGIRGNLLAMEIVAAIINEYDWPKVSDVD